LDFTSSSNCAATNIFDRSATTPRTVAGASVPPLVEGFCRSSLTQVTTSRGATSVRAVAPIACVAMWFSTWRCSCSAVSCVSAFAQRRAYSMMVSGPGAAAAAGGAGTAASGSHSPRS